MQPPLTFILAFIVVLALIGLTAWLVRRFAGNRLGANANRGRMPRLAVIDAAAVDGRRRLVLVRRDNVEHLLMIGGPTDIVVETNIVRAIPARDQMNPRAAVGGEMPPRVAPLPDTSGDSSIDSIEAALPESPPRPSRPNFSDEVRRPAPPPRGGDAPPSFMPDPVIRPEPRAERNEPAPVRPAPRPEPAAQRVSRLTEPPLRAPQRMPERAAPPAAPAAPLPGNAEQNLAEMAQRLEAALRRPDGESRVGAPPVAPEQPRGRSSTEVTSSASSASTPVAPPSTKTGFENLEDEMASLLGRPKSPS